MSEPKLLVKAELVDNKVRVTLGTKHEAILALAIRKIEIYVTEVLLENEFKIAEAEKSPIITPNSEVKASLIDAL